MARTGLIALLPIFLSPHLPENASAQGRRIVDAVMIGDAASERRHDFAAQGAADGVEAGRPYRRASSWQRYGLAVYDDSEVTLSLTFRGSDGRRERFALAVEGRDAGVHAFVSPSTEPATLEIRLPAATTAGRTSLIVVLRAVDGPTPGLMELRSVQEHFELQAGGPVGAAARANDPPSFHQSFW